MLDATSTVKDLAQLAPGFRFHLTMGYAFVRAVAVKTVDGVQCRYVADGADTIQALNRVLAQVKPCLVTSTCARVPNRCFAISGACTEMSRIMVTTKPISRAMTSLLKRC